MGLGYPCGKGSKPKEPTKLYYVSEPKGPPDGWRVEDRFREWGKEGITDDFAEWAYHIRLEEELKQLFIEDLNGRDNVSSE